MKLPKAIYRAAYRVIRAWDEIRGVHPRNPDAWVINAFGGSRVTASGVFVDDDTAMRYSAVFACVRNLAETLASLPLPLYRRVGPGKELALDESLFFLMHDQPNEEQTSFEWREMMEGHVALTGNAYSAIDRNNAGEISRLIPLNPDTTFPRRTPQGIVYEAHPGGRHVVLPSQAVLHIKWMSRDGLVGISPIEQYREAIGLGLAAEEFTSRFFSNDASPSGVLSHPVELGEKALQNLRDSIDKQTRGNANSHRYLILEEGMSWAQIGIAAKDAELINTRKFQIEDIARVYRMQLHKIGMLDKATFSNIEEQNIEFVVDTIRPWAVRWEQEMNSKLIDPEDKRELFFEFNLEGLLRGDSKTRSEFYLKMWQMGVFSGNDIAQKENMNPFPGGEKRFVPMNFVPLEEAGLIPDSDDVAPRGLLTEGETRIQLLESSDPLSKLEKRSLNSRRMIVARFRRLFLEAGQRIVSREVNELGRMITRTLSSREAIGTGSLVRNLNAFYMEFPQIARDILLPIAIAYGEAIGAAAAEEIGADVVLAPSVNALITEYAENFGVRHSISSRNQLQQIIREAPGPDLETQLRRRLSEWGTTRAGKIAQREPIQEGAAVARETYRGNGFPTLKWKTVGKNCPLCNQLDGKTVGIGSNFVNPGETVDPRDGETTPLKVRRGIKHPPLHQGCDCMVTAA